MTYDHNAAQERLALLASGDLQSAEETAVLDHLSACAACAADFDQIAGTIAAIARGAQAPPARPGRSLSARLRPVAAAALFFVAGWGLGRNTGPTAVTRGGDSPVRAPAAIAEPAAKPRLRAMAAVSADGTSLVGSLRALRELRSAR